MSIARNNVEKLARQVSLLDFGAKGDGVTNDTAAVQAALTYCQTRQVALLVPAGSYLITSSLTYLGSAGFALVGEGSSVTRFIFNAAGIGLSVRATEWRAGGILQVKGLALHTRYVGAAGTALTVGAAAYVTAAGTFKGLVLDDLDIANEFGTTASATYWANGIAIDNMPHPEVRGVWVRGNNGSFTGVGVRFGANVISPWLVDCNVYNWSTGCLLDGVDTEGGIIQGNHFIANLDGLVADTGGTETALYITNNEFDNERTGVRLDDRQNWDIVANRFYKKNDRADYRDVVVEGVSNNGTITANRFRRQDGANIGVCAVDLVSCSNIMVFGNWARDRGIGIRVADGVLRPTIGVNDLDGIATQISDLSVTSIDLKVIAGRKSLSTAAAVVECTAAQSLTDATDTIVTNWGALTDTGGGNHNGTSRLTVPAGVTKVRVTAQVRFASNATGRRAVRLLKNGSAAYQGCAETIAPAATGAVTIVNVASPPLSVAAAQYFEVQVYQNSGGALNVEAGVNCFFSIEVLA